MKRKFFFLNYFLIFSTILLGCSPSIKGNYGCGYVSDSYSKYEAREALNCEQSTENQNECVAFESYEANDSSAVRGNTENGEATISLAYLHPTQYANREVLAKIQKLFFDEYFGEEYVEQRPEQAVKNYSDEYLSTHIEFANEHFDDPDVPRHSFDVCYSSDIGIVYNENNLLSFAVKTIESGGTAHPIFESRFSTINLEDGHRLTLEDLFLPGYKEALRPHIGQNISAMSDNPNFRTREEMLHYIWDIEKIDPSNNFFITDLGIVFYYGLYEIGPYTAGEFEAFLPFEQIKGLIKDSSPIEKLL